MEDKQITVNTKDAEMVGTNLLAVMQGDTLILVVPDVKRDLGPSSTGKMNGVAKTPGGFGDLPGGLRGNIFIGRKN